VSEQLADYVDARHDVELAAARLRVADLSVGDPRSSVIEVNQAQDALTVAARKLTRATEALPMDRQRQIRGWVERTPVNSEGA